MTRLNQQEFDLDRGKALQQLGLGFAGSKSEVREDLIRLAREKAREIALSRPERKLTVDAVYKALLDAGYKPELLGNAWGSVFKARGWRFTGEYKKSERVSNHARIVRVWELVG